MTLLNHPYIAQNPNVVQKLLVDISKNLGIDIEKELQQSQAQVQTQALQQQNQSQRPLPMREGQGMLKEQSLTEENKKGIV